VKEVSMSQILSALPDGFCDVDREDLRSDIEAGIKVTALRTGAPAPPADPPAGYPPAAILMYRALMSIGTYRPNWHEQLVFARLLGALQKQDLEAAVYAGFLIGHDCAILETEFDGSLKALRLQFKASQARVNGNRRKRDECALLVRELLDNPTPEQRLMDRLQDRDNSVAKSASEIMKRRYPNKKTSVSGHTVRRIRTSRNGHG
jgi:hypothetical protein